MPFGCVELVQERRQERVIAIHGYNRATETKVDATFARTGCPKQDGKPDKAIAA